MFCLVLQVKVDALAARHSRGRLQVSSDSIVPSPGNF
jgi:hypothetical protein